METTDALLNRRSVREYQDKKVEDTKIRQILEAGLSAPSCTNARDWAFIVVDDKETLNKMADGNGRPAEPLRKCAFAILACGDLDRAFKRAPDYWIIDVSIAVENMIIQAQDLGIGSVWLGTYPQMDRVNAQKALFNLPENIVPHSIVAFGYPKENKIPEKKPYEADRIHYNQW